MSNSSDGWRGSRQPPPQSPSQAPSKAPDPETRADRRYGSGARRPPQADEGWHDPQDVVAWEQEAAHLEAGRDPGTGPPTFDFEPSPLQPRGPARGTAPPPPAQVQRGRLPQRPEDLFDANASAPGDHADLGAVQPEPVRPMVPQRIGADRAVLSAPTRTQRSNREMAHAPIVPAGSVTGRSLTLVIAIMCFLACLTAGAVYLMNQSANAWLRDIASEITVQVEAREKADMERQLTDVAAFLGRQPGITATRTLSLEASAGLLEPWLGQADGLKNLPVPRMIAVEIDRVSPPDFDVLRTNLSKQFKGTTLDDHRHWQRQIRTVTRSFALGGFAILMLVGAATMAIIVSATRSALASNRDIVEVLHFVGATDRFIARQFQKHFLWLGIRAGIFGAVLAGLGFLGMPVAMEFLGGGGSASVAELQHLIGTGALDLAGYGWLAAVVVVVAALCMLTSRIGVYRILHSQH